MYGLGSFCDEWWREGPAKLWKCENAQGVAQASASPSPTLSWKCLACILPRPSDILSMLLGAEPLRAGVSLGLVTLSSSCGEAGVMLCPLPRPSPNPIPPPPFFLILFLPPIGSKASSFFLPALPVVAPLQGVEVAGAASSTFPGEGGIPHI